MEMMNINNIEITRDQARAILPFLKSGELTDEAKDVVDFLELALAAPEFEEVDGIPTWAIYYLEYGDDVGLEDGEQEMIEDFLRSNHYRFSSVKDPDDFSFDNYPQFGKPCNTCTCYFESVKDKEKDGK